MYKIMYGYDKKTKYYTGEVRVQQDPSNPSIYLKPPFVTDIEPSFQEGKIPKFNGNGWDLVDDYYGKIVYDKETKESKTFLQHGELPDNLTDKEPLSDGFYVVFDEKLDDWKIDVNLYKNFKKSELTTAFRTQLSQGYVCPTSNIKMNATLEDIDKLQKGYDLEVKLGSSKMTIRDYNNDYHTLSLQDVETMLTELGQNYKNQLAKLWKLKDEVEVATSVEELDAISWDENE